MTLEQILVRDIHNNIGFLAGDRLLVMLEAQSTWSVNILVRSLMYIIRTYQEYFRESKQSLFSTKPVHMPVLELYVVYTGDRVIDKEYITLSEEFFNGKLTALEARMKVLTGDGGLYRQPAERNQGRNHRRNHKKVSRETAERVSKETVHAIYQDNVPVHKIASYLRKDTKTIEAWLGLNPQK